MKKMLVLSIGVLFSIIQCYSQYRGAGLYTSDETICAYRQPKVGVCEEVYQPGQRISLSMTTTSSSYGELFVKTANGLWVKTTFLRSVSESSTERTTNEWKGNGSGIVLSTSGHIVTNFHVIDDADQIEIEVIQDGEWVVFDAAVLQVDRVNDLAIIKVVDINFDSFDAPPFSVKFTPSEVGTKVYAYGYPMALTVMGKEVKVTDGIISAKTGFNGDITTYQISAPIQGGNSGGPLFDEQANLIGINSSGLNKDIADNVGYSIKSSYVRNVFDVLPKSVDLPKNQSLQSKTLVEQIAAISPFVVLIKVK